MAEPLFTNQDVSKPLGGVVGGTYIGFKLIGGLFSLLTKPKDGEFDNEMLLLEKEARSGKNVDAEFAFGYNLYQFAGYDKYQKNTGLRWLRKASARGSIKAKEFLDFIGEH